MNRRILIIAASVLALLLSILVWRAVSGNQDAAQTPASSETAPAQSNLKTPENQTPKNDSEKTESADETESAETAAETPDTSPYNFKTKDEAYQFFLQLYAAEYDRLLAEGHEEPSGKARIATYYPAFVDKTNPQLWNAMRPFLPRYDEDRNYIPDDTRMDHDWSSPAHLAVAAGKLPETALYSKATLPNGEVRYLGDFENLIVTYREKSILRPEDKPRVKEIERRYNELTDRYYFEDLSESEKQTLIAEIDTYERALRAIQFAGEVTSKNVKKFLHYSIHDPNPNPRHVTTEEDLGIIESYIDLDALLGDFGK